MTKARKREIVYFLIIAVFCTGCSRLSSSERVAKEYLGYEPSNQRIDGNVLGYLNRINNLIVMGDVPEVYALYESASDQNEKKGYKLILYAFAQIATTIVVMDCALLNYPNNNNPAAIESVVSVAATCALNIHCLEQILQKKMTEYGDDKNVTKYLAKTVLWCRETKNVLKKVPQVVTAGKKINKVYGLPMTRDNYKIDFSEFFPLYKPVDPADINK